MSKKWFYDQARTARSDDTPLSKEALRRNRMILAEVIVVLISLYLLQNGV